MRIYADNAATTKMSQHVLKVMIPYMVTVFGNPSSQHSMGQEASRAVNDARERIAAALGAHPSEIIFTSGGSEADNQAIYTAAEIGAANGKKHVISTLIEHHAVLNALDRLKQTGFELTLLPVEPGSGLVAPDQVAKAIREDTAFVSVMYANNEIGTIEPIAEIGAICRERGVIFHTDAVQAVGHLPIHVKDQNIDMLSLSAHKFNGPKGVGVLYAKRGINVRTLIEGGGQENGRRSGTENVPAIVGMSVALEDACADMGMKVERLTRLRDRLIEGLNKIPCSSLNGDPSLRLPGNVSFCFEGTESALLLQLLDKNGICASSGSACASGLLGPSHVLMAIGRDENEAQASLRLSIGHDITEEQVDFLIKAVSDAVRMVRCMPTI